MGKRLRSSFGFWVLFAYAAMLCASLAWQTFAGASAKRELRGFHLQHALRVAKPLLRDGRTRELSHYLREALEMDMIDSFELELLNKPTEKGGIMPDVRPVLAEPVSEIEGWIWGKAESADASLRLGSGTGWRARLALAVKAEASRLPFDAGFLVLALVLSVFFQGRMRVQAKRSATTVVRESRRAKVLRSERVAAPNPEPLQGSGVFARACLGGAEGAEHSRLEAFFADCASLVSRYGGRAASLHGHELLVAFLDGDPGHQARLALALSRDLESLAESRGFTFTIALAIGELGGTQLFGGSPTFLGAPVEETAAINRAQLQQKKSGLRLAPALQALCKDAIHAFDAALSGCRGGNSAELAYHRSDAAIGSVLRALAEGGWEREAYVSTMNELRMVSCQRCGAEVVEAFRSLLGAELKGKDSYRLSGTLALAPHLLSRQLIDKDLEKKFLESVKVKDRRVRANAVELFTRFFPEREIAELRPLIRDEDNRVSANALVKAACERFDEKVIAKLDERVKGGSVAHVASALHAMGEIAAYYRRSDPLFLGTKIAFLRLFDGTVAWAQHPNPMIRRQAILAARKLASPSVTESLRHLFENTDDPELLSLFASIYSWKRGSKDSAA